jgi:hypothetical protein
MKMDTARLKLGENKFMKLQELIGKIELRSLQKFTFNIHKNDH